MSRTIRSTPFLVVALWLIWGSAFVAIKVGLGYASPEAFAVLRVAAALLALVPAVMLGVDGRRGAGDRRIHGFGAVLGLTNVVGFLTFQNLGMVESGIGLSSVLIYTQPLLVTLGARLLFAETLTARKVLGVVAGWCGVIALVAGELGLGSAPLSSILLLLAAAASWTTGTLLFKWLPTGVPVWRLLLAQNAYGLVPIALLALVRDAAVQWEPMLVVAGLWAGIAASVGGFGLQFVLLRRREAGVVSSWIFAVPVIASALGVVLLGERLHPGLVVGVAAVGFGVYLVNSTPRARARAQALQGP